VTPLPEQSEVTGAAGDPSAYSQAYSASGSTSSVPLDAATRRTRLRRRGYWMLCGAVFVGLGGAVAYEFLISSSSESTDDAYVAGDVFQITSRESGSVVAIHADNTQGVKRGQVLVELDPAVAEVQLSAAEAELARAVRSVRADFSRVDEADAEISQAETQLARAKTDLSRRSSAASEGAVSQEDVSHAADDVRAASAALMLARSHRAQAVPIVAGTKIADNPRVLAAIATVRRAAIARSHQRLAAPVDGIVAQRSVQLGQQVASGAPLMVVVPLQRVWIDANFRETQLADLREGQSATVTADAYGSRVRYHGKVVGLAAGTGSAFALLPPQNASGNWIKITQRLPVRIALDPRELETNPLRIGLSVSVSVDTGDHRGAPVGQGSVGTVQRAISEDGGAAADERIQKIIAENDRAGVSR
jgi:membrane fusion protein (multidrug efflux system)